MKITTEEAVLLFDEINTAKLEGSLRLANLKEYDLVLDFLHEVANKSPEKIVLDLTDLRFLNSSGITTLSMFILEKKKSLKPKITVLGSNKIPWQDKSLSNFNKLWTEVQIIIE